MREMKDLVLESGKHVKTLFGEGITLAPKRIADLILPTGVMTIGFPSRSLVNQTCDVHPHVLPGRYAVYMIHVQHQHHEKTWKSAGFVVVEFQNVSKASYTNIGGFFTDSGDGVLVDMSLEEHLRATKRKYLNEERRWSTIKEDVVWSDGNGEVIVDESTGANAIIFFTGDGYYDVWIGRGEERGELTSVIVDGVSRRMKS